MARPWSKSYNLSHTSDLSNYRQNLKMAKSPHLLFKMSKSQNIGTYYLQKCVLLLIFDCSILETFPVLALFWYCQKNMHFCNFFNCVLPLSTYYITMKLKYFCMHCK